MPDWVCYAKTFSTLTNPLFTTIFGAIFGGGITWYLATKATLKASRRDALLDLAETIEGIRSYYEDWFVHRTSPSVLGPTADTVKIPELYHHYLEEVQKHEGRLIAIRAALVAYFPDKVIGPLQAAIGEVLKMTAFSVEKQTPIEDVNKMVAAIRILIPDLLQEYT